MVKGKEGISRKNIIDFAFICVLSILLILIFASNVPAQIVIVSTANWTNWTTTAFFNVSYSNYSDANCGVASTSCDNITNAVNATFYYNSSAGVWTEIGTVPCNNDYNNTCSGQLDISTIPDGKYTINVSLNNGTIPLYMTNDNGTIYNVTFDSTPPNVSFAGITNMIDGAYVNATTMVLNVTVNDPTVGLSLTNRSVHFNISYSNGTQVNFTWSNASSTFSTPTTSATHTHTIDISNYADGVYNITVYANDSAANLVSGNTTAGTITANLNNSETIQITIDHTVPTVTHTCSPNTTIGQIVTCTCSGTDATAGVNYTYDGDDTVSTASIVKTITATSTGVFSRTCTATDRAGNIATTVTASYEITNPTSGGTTNGGAPSGTSTSTVSISGDVPTTVAGFVEGSGVSEIKLEVTESASNVGVTVTKYDSKPSVVSASKSNSYKYFQIETKNLGDKLSKATMKIQVEKNWVTTKGITKEDVALFKYDETGNVWNELTTTFKEEDDTYYYYDAEVSSFSYFAIASKKEIPEDELPSGEEVGVPTWIWIVVGLVVLAIIIGGGIALKKKKK